MARIRYDSEIMNYISLFESLTGARVKDCIADDSIIFILHKGQMGRAIGKEGSNIKKMENLLKRKIRLAEFSEDVSQFLRSLIYPLKVEEIKEEEGIVTICSNDRKTKGMLIGRERHNITLIENILKRHFKVNEVRVS
ncbi:NusA-like transcription termination signal-binding factor [Candidatus Woesearchaeota archaeon]|nr:NusA-like transcription termination signal-binding factor [Candidatus Woesearchaeota archaeon]